MKQEWVPAELQTQEALQPLIEAAQDGDRAAMEELAWRVHPLVLNLANKYGHGKLLKAGTGHGRYTADQQAEILQEAWAGFADAVERYDPSHKGGRKFWTVAGYRIKEAIQQWQAKHSGGLGMPRRAWQTAWLIDKSLEADGVVDWEAETDQKLKEITGVHSAGHILRARTPGHSLYPEDDKRTALSAEDEYLNESDYAQWLSLLTWLGQLEEIATEHWEEATYWKLEDLGLAGAIEASTVVAFRDAILEDQG